MLTKLLLRPTAGTATVAGSDLLRDPAGVRRRIGYVPQAIGYLNSIMVEGVAVSIGLAILCLWLASRAFIKENA